MRETLDIPVRHEQACYAVLHDVWNSAVRPANHRFGMGHGFQKHEAKTFSPAGQGEDVTVCVAGEELLRRQTVEKVRVFRNTEIASELFKSWPVVSVADKHERMRPAPLSGRLAERQLKCPRLYIFRRDPIGRPSR